MEKFENVNSWNDLVKMNLDDVVEFHNTYKKLINNGEMTEEEFNAKFGFAIGSAFNFVYSNDEYSSKGGYLKKQPKKKRKKNKKPEEKLTLSDAEILAIKKLISNATADTRSANEELVAGDKTAKQCIYFVDQVDQKFKEYCQNHKRFNRSEHVMMALLEYMEKYK